MEIKTRTIKKLSVIILFTFLTAGQSGGCSNEPTSNDIQREQQDKILEEGTTQIGMPAIKNFRERKLLKDIFELRDQEGLVTYTYLFSENTGKKTFFCNSIGYGIPYSTQYTAPETMQRYHINGSSVNNTYWGAEKMPQADPNGLFSPASADGTWILCKDTSGKTKNVRPIYVEPKIIVSPFKLKED